MTLTTERLTTERLKENLCTYDRRYSYFEVTALSYDTQEETPEAMRENCMCDNCFYGRSELANELLRLRGIK